MINHYRMKKGNFIILKQIFAISFILCELDLKLIILLIIIIFKVFHEMI